MLASPFRLRKKEDVERVLRRGRSVYGDFITLRTLPNAIGNSRATVVAGLKVHKKATKRNAIKRRVREVLRHHWGAIKPGCDVAILVKSEALKASFQDIEKDVGIACRRAGILKG
ncbi:MAG: ribonuclease P protein component [Patescibacteria group bacterium]